MVFLPHFVQVSHFGMYANCAGWQCLIQISLKCRGSHASKMACLSLQLQRDFYHRRTRRGESLIARKHQEKRRKPGILLKCWHSSRKSCVHATVLPCISDDVRSIQHCFIFLWVLECPYPNFSRHGNTRAAHGCVELGR